MTEQKHEQNARDTGRGRSIAISVIAVGRDAFQLSKEFWPLHQSRAEIKDKELRCQSWEAQLSLQDRGR
jgi:hypothetical protein